MPQHEWAGSTEHLQLSAMLAKANIGPGENQYENFSGIREDLEDWDLTRSDVEVTMVLHGGSGEWTIEVTRDQEENFWYVDNIDELTDWMHGQGVDFDWDYEPD